MKKWLVWSLFLVFAANLAFGAQQGGVLVFGRGGDSSTMDPALATDGETFYATTQIYDNLVQFKYGTTEIEPALAESWEASDNGLEYTFKLRQGVKFHRTSYFKQDLEFTADDVIFSLMRQKMASHPFHKVGGGSWEYWNGMDMSNIVKDIVKIDKYTVKFILSKPEAPFIANLAMDFASILSKGYADDLAKKEQKEKLTTQPIGTGPFVFQVWRKDDSISFFANKNYWGGRPYLDRLILRVITNNSARAAELKTGAIHVMDFPNPAEIPALRKNTRLKMVEQEGLNVGYLAFNTEKIPLNNVKVRRAVAMAINREAIVGAIYSGMGKVAKNPLPPTMWSYNNNIIDHEYNVSKAKALLAEAGFPDGFSTTLWAMPVARPYNPNARKVAEAMQADLRKIGITARIVSYDWGTYLNKSKQGEHDMLLLGWTGDNGDPDNFLYTLLSKAAAKKPAANRAFYQNDEFNELIEAAKTATSTIVRTALYEKAQEIFHRDVPWLTIAHSIVVEPMRTNVMGFKLDPVGKRRFKDVWLDK